MATTNSHPPLGPRSDARRQDILRAALDEFSTAGFHGTTVRQIARAAGLNEATLYHYYPSKDAMLAALVQQILEWRRQKLAAVLPTLQPGARGATLVAQVGLLLRAMGEDVLRTGCDPEEVKLTRLILLEGPRLAAEGRIVFEALFRSAVEPLVNELRALEDGGAELGLDVGLLVQSFVAPLILWRLNRSMSPTAEDEAQGLRLLGHQVQLVTAAVAAAQAAASGAAGRGGDGAVRGEEAPEEGAERR